MMEYAQRTMEYVQQKVLPIGYACFGAAFGIALGLGHALAGLVPEEVPKTFHNLVKRSKSIALEARKEAESAVESVKGSVEKFKNNGLKTAKTAKNEGKKKTSEAVNEGKKKTSDVANGIKANGHAVPAG
ncbi:hypothetical protein COCSUDRAFT_65677 [Coccomyxa subellipsoidea C-169]|uniref:Uncharacterized protein n=1 Tax=Coccomyxa subellipsoidea (strain C-169) TaxID=574566 RepID=I0Z012_COCSC|nr:hypothetical protein COCSUDRAFT_65677 [Coccomyxa subellipsoidea C-169]EIE23981.1 hypothetical protein COCSUDRAFT_65677 [Coccomyxa subellipsoidea C-169]|eukprot:XP_005648525.1 hypothetical protein COCSUDRAFT_65677 [Coccomyxa subellipsoidea C-169]